MHASEIRLDAPPCAAPSPSCTAATAAPAPTADAKRLVSDLGSEIAAPLTVALEHLDQLSRTGRIDAADLADLRLQVECARQAAMIGQRLGRLACGRIRQAAERLDLTRLLRAAVDEHTRVIAARGLEVREILRPAEVVADTALAYSLVQALVDWSLEHAFARMDFSVDFKTWPVHARLCCRFAFAPEDTAGLPDWADARRLDTMTWHLLQQTALAMGLAVQREVAGGHVRAVIEFPRTVSEPIKGVSVVEVDDPQTGYGLDPGTLAGSHVLVIAARRETRMVVRDAIRSMGLLVDFVASLDEARRFCEGGPPQAIVYEAAQGGEGFERWRRQLQSEEPAPGFIEIGVQGREHETLVRDGRRIARVGRDGLMATLPAALGFELGRALATS
jgi:hypothetical protein